MSSLGINILLEWRLIYKLIDENQYKQWGQVRHKDKYSISWLDRKTN